MVGNGGDDTEKRRRTMHDDAECVGVDAKDIWAYAAGEVPPERRDEVSKAIARTPFASEELGVASFVMNDDVEPSAAVTDVEPVMERIRGLYAASDWTLVDVRASSSHGTSSPVIDYRVIVKPRVSCHALLFSIALDAAGLRATRLYPPEPAPLGAPKRSDRPNDSLPSGVAILMPSSGVFTLSARAAFLVLCTRRSVAFDESAIASIRRELMAALCTIAIVDRQSLEVAIARVHFDDLNLDWRPLRFV